MSPPAGVVLTDGGPVAAVGDESREEGPAQIAEWLSERGVTRVTVAVGGAEFHAYRRRLIHPVSPPGRTVTRDDMAELREALVRPLVEPDRELVGVIPGRAIVDGTGVGTTAEGISGETFGLEAFVGTVPRRAVSAIRTALLEKEIEPVWMPRPLVLAQGLLGESPGGVAVHLEGERCEWAVRRDGRLYDAGALPSGLTGVLREVAAILGMDENTLAKLVARLPTVDPTAGLQEWPVYSVHVRGEARTVSGEVVARVLAARVEPLATALRQRVMRAAPWIELPSGLVLAGAGLALPGLDTLFARGLPELPHRVSAAHDARAEARLAARALPPQEQPDRLTGKKGRNLLSWLGGR